MLYNIRSSKWKLQETIHAFRTEPQDVWWIKM
jgi:hypothetical protein